MAVMLPPLVQQIILDPSGLRAGAAKSKQAMAPVGKAMTAAAASTATMGQSLNTLGFRAMTTGRTMMKFLVAPLAVIGVTSIKSFATFEAHMAKIQALVGVTAGSVERMAKRVKEAAAETGRSPQELANAMFFVASAGLRGSVALDVLSASAKGAAVGLGETKVVADAATSAINAYGAENLPAAEAVDVLTAAVREGKVEANRLAPAIGKAIPVAAAMGIEFHEVAAAIAAMTRTGTDSRTSAIQLRQIMQSILDPSRQTTRALREMGIAEGELIRQARDEGLLAVLKRLRVEADKNADAFADVFPNIRALAGALDITGPNLAENEQIFKALANSVGDTDKAFEITSKTVANKMARAFSELKNSYLELGEALLPLADILIAVIKKIAAVFNFIGDTPMVGAAIIGIVTLSAVMAGFLIMLGNVATSIAFKAQMTAYMAAQDAVATTTTVVHTTATKGQAAALLLSAKAAKISAASMRMLMLAMNPMVFIPVIIAIGAIAGMMGLFGKKTKSSTEKVQDLVDAIKDVRMVGGRAITTLGGMGAVVTSGIGGSNSEVFQEVANFKESYDQEIQKVFEENPEQAQAAIETALNQAFAGVGDSLVMRTAINEIIRGYDAQLGGNTELFERLFADGFEGAEWGRFLGPVGDASAEALYDQQRIGLENLAEIAAGMVEEPLQKFNQSIADSIASGALDPDAIGGFDISIVRAAFDEAGLDEGLASISDDLDDFLRKGQIEDFVTLYNALLAAISENVSDPAAMEYLRTEMTNLSDLIPTEFAIRVGLDASGIDTYDAQSVGESLRKISSVQERMDAILGRPESSRTDAEKDFVKEWKDALDEVPASMLNVADRYRVAEQNVRSVNDRLIASFVRAGDANGAQAAQMTDAEVEAAAYALVIAGVEAEVDALADTTYDYVDALADLETVYAQADARAKGFTGRFDDLIGRNIAVEEATMAWHDSLMDVSEALHESEGAIVKNSKAGRESRGSILDAIEGAKDMAAAWLESGDEIDDVAARYMMMLQALGERMELGGMNPDQINKFFDDIGVHSLNLDLSFMDDPAQAAETSAELQRVIEMIVAGAVNPITGLAMPAGAAIYTGTVKGFQREARKKKKQLVAVFDEFTRAQLRSLGIIIPEGVEQVFYGIGETIISEQARLLLEESAGLTHVIQRAVEESMNSADGAMRAGIRRINASMDFSEAERKLDRMRETTHGGLGIDTVYEGLQEDQLERRVADAERALRLGQGHQEDLKLALMEAEFALEDFRVAADEGSDVFKAEIALAEAGQEVANAEAAMRIEGDLAVTTFNNLAAEIGMTTERLGELYALTGEDDFLFNNLISDRDRLWINEVMGGRDMSSTREPTEEEEDTGLPPLTPEAIAFLEALNAGSAGGGIGFSGSPGGQSDSTTFDANDIDIPFTGPGWDQLFGNVAGVDWAGLETLTEAATTTGSVDTSAGGRQYDTDQGGSIHMTTNIVSSGDMQEDLTTSLQVQSETGMNWRANDPRYGNSADNDSWRGTDPRYADDD